MGLFTDFYLKLQSYVGAGSAAKRIFVTVDGGRLDKNDSRYNHSSLFLHNLAQSKSRESSSGSSVSYLRLLFLDLK